LVADRDPHPGTLDTAGGPDRHQNPIDWSCPVPRPTSPEYYQNPFMDFWDI